MKSASFAATLRKHRLAKRWTQARLSKEAGYAGKSNPVQHYEAGRRIPELPTILKLAKALEIPPHELLRPLL